MPEILSIHNELFNYLSDWSVENRFTKSDTSLNPFFILRSASDKRLPEGYWLPGEEDFAYVSFWKGGDSLNRTPNIYMEVATSGQCRGRIVAKDSKDKENYFQRLIVFLIQFGIEYMPTSDPGVWESLQMPQDNYITNLETYLKRDKFYIDRFVIENDPRSMISDYSSSFGLMSADEYEDTYSKVKQQKNLLEEQQIKEEAKLISTGKIRTERPVTYGGEYRSMPYALKGINIRNYQGIKETYVENLPTGTQWIFITGENGYGKTSVLQAIALGLTDDRVLDTYMAKNSRIEVDLHSLSSQQTIVRLPGSTRGATYDRPDQVIIGYGPVRLNTAAADGRNQEGKSSNNVMNLFRTATLLKNLQYELFAKKHTSKRAFNQLEKAIREATNGRIDKIVVKGEDVLFSEKLSNGDVLEPVKLEFLAAGFRSVINIIGDIIIRYGDRPGFQDYKDYSGLVLIDEIENHLHPLLQRELPEALSRVFPNIQFIASTHSPIPLLGAPKKSVIITVSRSLEDGIEVERWDDQIDFANLLPNTILTSPIFGFEKIIPAANVNISEIETSPDFATSKEVKEIRESLNLKMLDIDAIDKRFDEERGSSEAGSVSPA
jgi:predicted ATP-binding protein involved in virulence